MIVLNYHVENGIYKLDFNLSKLEREILLDCAEILESAGFKYLSVPTTIKRNTFTRQEISKTTYEYGSDEVLAGSAEQGILEYFSNSIVEPMKIYAQNTCFRTENKFEGLKRVKEFTKVEQYIFCHKKDVEENFELMLENARKLLRKYEIKFREVNVTNIDPGYHMKKIDIEVWTKQYGWMETHSCSYFGTEQSKRYGITGANHTMSNTGVATPRILVPLIEKMN
jgi:seryl-tRNA synthetase